MKPPPHTLIVIFTLTVEILLLGYTTNGMTSIFPLLTFHSWAVISLLHPHTAFTYTVNPLCQSLFKLSGLHGAWESAHYKVVEPGVSKSKLVSTLKMFYRRHHDLLNPYNVAVSRIVSDVCQWRAISRLPKSRTYASTYISFVQACGRGRRSLLTK